MRTKTCKRCGEEFIRGNRDPDVFCGTCEMATKDDTLFAVLYSDRSGILDIKDSFAEAAQIVKDDAEGYGLGLMVKKVRGQSGARSELDTEDPTSAWWDHAEAAWDRADYERDTV